LRQAGYQVTGLFYNPNIHPWREYDRRARAMGSYASMASLPLMKDDGYELEPYLTEVLSSPAVPGRCYLCYRLRLLRAARAAREGGFAAFTTTLLGSPFQHHQLVQRAGQEAAQEHQVEFLYQDFRLGWAEGMREAKAAGLYRQNYCGCIFSEWERFGAGRGDHARI
jgi:predicted adenine nucleotide alpha hydrolase (AANH) superfamily ATPase